MGLNIVVQDIIRDGITRVSTILHWGELICFLKEVIKPKVSYYYLGSNSYHFQDPIFGNKFLSLSGSHNRVFRERLEWVGEPGKTHRRNQRNPVRIRTKKFNKSGREGQYNQKFEVIFIDSSTETIGKWSVTGKTKDFFFFF